MREILFRGKQEEGRWVEGAYFKHDTVKVCFSSDDSKPRHLIIQDGFCDWGLEPPIHCVDVAPSTIGQFTGLTDKNGKKIFEGDVCRFYGTDGYSDYVVFWDDTVSQWTVRQIDLGAKDVLDSYFTECCEIIGNIHDNPELLEVGKE